MQHIEAATMCKATREAGDLVGAWLPVSKGHSSGAVVTGSDCMPDQRAVAWYAEGAVSLGHGFRQCCCSSVYRISPEDGLG